MTEKDINNAEEKASDGNDVQAAETSGSNVEDNPIEEQEPLDKVAGSEGGRNSDASDESKSRNSGNWNIDLLLDVELPIRVSFGQTEMQLRDVFKLGAGSVIELDKSVNDPVTVIVNNKPIAKGEVVMVDGNYGVRILEVESTADRIRSLG
ncbi:MAG: flagellar motor switch protein FliN [Acidobacteria bacterium]|nr:flagellar motor switch protein FliN [Acidobacteriota bacterium]